MKKGKVRKIVIPLGRSFRGVLDDVKYEYGDSASFFILALRRDERPNYFKGREEWPLLEKTQAFCFGTVVFIEDIDPQNFGRDLEKATVIMNGGTTSHAYTCIRIFDGLREGRLINLQRNRTVVLEEK